MIPTSRKKRKKKGGVEEEGNRGEKCIFSLRNANFRFFAFSNISLVGILLASAISSFCLFDRFFSHSKGMTKNISRVHFCVNVKRNRSRMKPRNPASKENRGLQLEEKLPSVSRNSALIQQCTDSTNYGRVLQVVSECW